MLDHRVSSYNIYFINFFSRPPGKIACRSTQVLIVFEIMSHMRNKTNYKTRLVTRSARLNSVLGVIMTSIKERQPDTNIDIPYLKRVYAKQNGRDPYQNIELAIIPRWEREALNISWLPNGLSIDRVDSSKGYFKGNVQFVGTLFNKVKQNLSNQALFELAKTIIKNRRRYNFVHRKIKEIR